MNTKDEINTKSDDARYARTKLLYGEENFKKIKKSHIAVVGLGAVGSHVVEGIVRTGVGKITIIDFDKISISNFNRQLYAIEPNLDKFKTDSAKERILQINPDVEVFVHNVLCHTDNFAEVFANKPDVVIDAIDTLNPKVNLLMWLTENNIEVVSSMGAARKFDPTMITVNDISKVSHCPLAKMVKKRLKKYNALRKFRCVFSTELPEKETIAEKSEPNFLHKESRERLPMGSSPMITGIFGYYCALEAIKIIIEK